MVGAQETQNAPQLVVTKPDRLRGRAYAIAGEYAIVGRQEGCELRLDEVAVSRIHAALRRSEGQTVVSDLGSSNGTTVNGDPVGTTGRPLQPGDVLRVGDVEMRFEPARSDATEAAAAVRPDRPHQAEYRVQSQTAGQVNNVGHDQHNAYIQQILQERDSFARDIAATKTKARRLIWAGFVMFVLGFGTYMWVILRFVGEVDDFSGDPSDTKLLGPDVGGMPVGAIGFALAALGSMLMVVGVVLHVVAASRRRRFQAQQPAVPWQFSPPPPRQGW